jgi:formylglycine-generating enzyme required for sulfatase activity
VNPITRLKRDIRLGVIVDESAGEQLEAITAALEVHLGNQEKTVLIDRESLAKVADELALVSALSSAEGPSELNRSALLDADALVVLTSSEQLGDRLLLLETRWGLRLLSLPLVIPSDRIDEAAQELSEIIVLQIAEVQTNLNRIVAIPSFIDGRLRKDPPEFHTSLTETARRLAGRVDGVVVIETDQAQAIQREIGLRGENRFDDLPSLDVLHGELLADGVKANDLRLKLTASREGRPAVLIDQGQLTAADTVTQLTRQIGLWLEGDAGNQFVSNEATINELRQAAERLAQAGDPRAASRLIDTVLLMADDDLVVELYREKMKMLARASMRYMAGGVIPNEDSVQIYRELLAGSLEVYRREIGRAARGQQVKMNASMGPIDTGFQMFVQHSRVAPAPIYEQVIALRERYFQDLFRLILSHDLETLNRFPGEELSRPFLAGGLGDKDITAFMTPDRRVQLAAHLQGHPQYDAMHHLLFWREDPDAVAEAFRRHHARQQQAQDKLSLFATENARGSVAERKAMELAKGPVVGQRPEEYDRIEYRRIDRFEHLIQIEPKPLQVIPTGADRINHTPLEPLGWVDAGELGEIIYTRFEVFLVKGRDHVESIYTVDPAVRKYDGNGVARTYSAPCYDGRYIWITQRTDPGLLIAYDTTSGRTLRFSTDDGVPSMLGGAAVGAVGPGSIAVAGSTNFMRDQANTWVALAEIEDEDQLSLKIIRQRRGTDTADDGLATRAPWIVREATSIKNPQDPSEAAVIFDFGSQEIWWPDHQPNCKLIVQPSKNLTSLVSRGRYVVRGMVVVDSFTGNGGHYFGEYDPYSANKPVPFYRIGFPHFHPKLARPDALGQGYGGSARYGDHELSVGRYGVLWASLSPDKLARPIAKLVSPDESFGVIRGTRHSRLFHSRYFGLVLMHRDEWHIGTQRLFSVDLSPIPKEAYENVIPPHERGLRTVGGHIYAFEETWSYEQAQEFAQAYGARLFIPTDRRSLDWLLAVCRERDSRRLPARVWTGLESRGGRLYLAGRDDVYTPPAGVKNAAMTDGLVAINARNMQLISASAELAGEVVLEWPDPDAATRDLSQPPSWLPLVELPAGQYQMGNPDPADPLAAIEPLKQASVRPGLWMGAYEISREQYKYVMDNGPEPRSSRGLPVTVNIWDAFEFCQRLSVMTGHHYRLPTEEEWEYACRAGSTTRFASGDTVEDLRRIGHCSVEGQLGSAGNVAYTGSFEPNAWGLYDMHGNIVELTNSIVEDGQVTSRPGPSSYQKDKSYIVRGGSWMDDPGRCQSSSRRVGTNQKRLVGFRVIRDTRRER